MKKSLYVLMTFFFTAASCLAQNSMRDLFNGRAKLTFLGLDFTQAAFIGTIGFNNPAAIQEGFLAQWNALLVNEPEKYSLQHVFRLTENQYATKVEHHLELNKKVVVLEKISNEYSYSINEEQVKNSVSQYTIKDKEGIGISFVVESFNKTFEKAVIWVTFIDLSSNTVLLTERMEGKPMGFGFRNYWAGAVYSVITKMKEKQYHKWSNLY